MSWPGYQGASEEAHYHPTARGIWGRLIDAHERRGLAFDAEALAVVALTLAEAPRDPLDDPRGCIFERNGRECPGGNRPLVGHLGCDIPF